MWRTCSSPERSTASSNSSGRGCRRPSISRSIHSKNARSLTSATLTASIRPARATAAGWVSRNRKSLTTPNGTAKAPIQFFLPSPLIAHLTPIPLSHCASVVVGNRTSRTPRCAVAAANPAASNSAPPPTASTYEWRSMRWRSISPHTRRTSRSSAFTASPPGTSSTPRKSNSRSLK